MKRHTEPKLERESAFTKCLMEGDSAEESSRRSSRRNTLGLSVGIEAVLLGLLILAPILTSGKSAPLQFSLPVPIALGPWSAHRLVRQPSANPAHASKPPAIPMPSLVLQPGAPVRVPLEVARVGVQVDDPFAGFAIGPDESFDVGLASPTLEPRKVDRPVIDDKKPLKVSEGVVAAQLISRVEPQYPVLAVQIQAEGSVRLHAIISREGRIEALDVLSGSPLLVQAALAAVKQWRYRPTYLNGAPVEVETSITVIFRLQR